MIIEKEITNWTIKDINNFCIETDMEVEVRAGKVFLQIAEIIQK